MDTGWRGWLVVGILLTTTAYVVAEEIRLTTYYPSPMGVYQELRVGTGELGTPHAKLQVNQPTDDGLLALRVTDQPNDPTPFVIDQQGNVGIGTEDPGTAKLAVLGGNVGIGTTNPTSRLVVADTLNASGKGVIIGNTSSPFPDVDQQHTTGLYISSLHGANVGPSVVIDADSSISGGEAGFYIRNSRSVGGVSASAQNDTIGGLNLSGHDGASYRNIAKIFGYVDTSVSSNDIGGRLVFSTRPGGPGGVITERMRLTSAGNVGIGTTDPQEKLDVNGSIRSSADIQTTSGMVRGKKIQVYEDQSHTARLETCYGAGCCTGRGMSDLWVSPTNSNSKLCVTTGL